MSLVGIQPDDYTPEGMPPHSDASSPRWTALLREAGHEVREVDVRRADILEQLRGCDGFMWRWPHSGGARRIASRLLPVLEREWRLAVYPDQNTCWHYDDKIAQAWLFEAAGIPAPRTFIGFDERHAREWARAASYPVVLKIASGAGSTNVRLVRSPAEAFRWIDLLFGPGVTRLPDPASGMVTRLTRVARAAARRVVRGPAARALEPGDELQKNYVIFQEFLPGNAFDTRVTVIGRRAFAYRRFNRPGDFRASGSGDFDPDPAGIDERFVRLAFDAARRLRVQSMAIDGLLSEGKPVIAEISYAYVSWMVQSCPGHWELEGDPASGALRWVEGRMWPEEAQVQDFLVRLSGRS